MICASDFFCMPQFLAQCIKHGMCLVNYWLTAKSYNCLRRTIHELLIVTTTKTTVLGTLKTVHYLLILVKIYSTRQENSNDCIWTSVVKGAKYNPFSLRKPERPAGLRAIQSCQVEKHFADLSHQRVSLRASPAMLGRGKSSGLFSRDADLYGEEEISPNTAVSHRAALELH